MNIFLSQILIVEIRVGLSKVSGVNINIFIQPKNNQAVIEASTKEHPGYLIHLAITNFLLIFFPTWNGFLVKDVHWFMANFGSMRQEILRRCDKTQSQNGLNLFLQMYSYMA